MRAYNRMNPVVPFYFGECVKTVKPDGGMAAALKKKTVLLLEDDELLAQVMRRSFQSKGISLEIATSVDDAIALIKKTPFALALVDIHLANGTGFGLLDHIKKMNGDLPVIMLTGSRDLGFAINALRLGAADYLLKPVEFEELWERIRKYLEMPPPPAGGLSDDSVWKQLGLIGVSPLLAEVQRQVEIAAGTNLGILITGESGTGKELCASAVHMLSRRSAGPFVAVNCAALGESIFHAEMFGHKKGSFTGADETRNGYIEAADGGTLFMDEIGEVPLSAQSKLLRAIETGEFNLVGERRVKHVDVRYVAATNRNLLKEIAEGHFREDLYYRLNVISIHLPPLRERKEDIPLLVEHYISRFSNEHQKPVKRVSPALISAMKDYLWPGNVRQLLNMIARAIAFSEGSMLELADFPAILEEKKMAPVAALSPTKNAAKTTARNSKNEEIGSVLAQAKGDINLAAELLKISRATLYRKIRQYAIDLGQFRNPS